jgi:hypothetical protein
VEAGVEVDGTSGLDGGVTGGFANCGGGGLLS